MFKEVYDKILVIGRVLVSSIPVGYEMPPKNHVAVVSSMAQDAIYTSDEDMLYEASPFFVYEDEDTVIALTSITKLVDTAQNIAPGTIIVNSHAVFNGKVKHVVCVVADSSAKSIDDTCAIISTLVLALSVDTIKHNISIISSNTGFDTSMATVNLYSAMVLIIAILESIGIEDETMMLRYVRASYTDKVKGNITLYTIKTIRKMLKETSLADLLDNSVILIVYNSYHLPEFQQEYPDFKIDKVMVDDEETDMQQLASDCVPMLIKFGTDTIYRAVAYEGDLHEFVDDPEHYLILYIRTDDDGNGNWATFETKPVRVNFGGTVILPSDVDISSVLRTDDDGKSEYILIDDISFSDIPLHVNDITGDNKYPSFEQFIEWVSLEISEDDRKKFYE